MNKDISSLGSSLTLSLEQKFKMRIFQESVEAMNIDEARSLLVEASQLLMVKDNIIKNLIKQDLSNFS